MLLGQILSLVVIATSLITTYLILKHKKIEISNTVKKIVSGVLAVVFVFRFMLGQDALRYIFALNNSPIESNALTAISLILNWAFYSVVLLVILYPFFKNSQFASIIKYYGTIVTLLCAGFIYYLSTGIVGVNAYSGFQIRTLLMGVEIGITLAYCFVVFMENDKFKIKKSDLWGGVYIAGMLLATMPPYMLEALFGNFRIWFDLKELAPAHRVILYLSILIPIALYLLLKNKNKEMIRGILLYISLGTLLSFSASYKFENFLNVTSWPFHLCNTAMYIIPLCLIFKWEKLFYFTYFINVLGAFLAMVMPNYSDGLNLFDYTILRFYINHFIAFFMPILMVSLKVYGRPKLKQFKYSMIGFGIYFVLVLILNAWFSNYGTVDYFFLNSDFIAEKLGTWAEDLRNIVWSFKINDLITFTFYPLYQFLFFVVYVFLGLGMWFIYEQGYAFADMLGDIIARNKKIKMDKLAIEVSQAKLNGENVMDKNVEAKIKLINFSKRYGSSKNFAVVDANLEINGGEIFGFLGHNGAGKSTIIKSIVGIQPITSGKIEVCGYDVDSQPVLTKQNIGFVPDHYALYEKLTGREYINYIADLYDVGKEEREQAIEKYVKLFELEDAIDNQIKTYSHGMKQKITIMSALVHNPKVWILDEPLTGLDPTSIFQVKECMRQHAKAGNIVFFSSHIIDVVESICDRIAIIKKGKILTVKTLKEIEQTCGLEQFYLKTIEGETTNEIVEENKIKTENAKKLNNKTENAESVNVQTENEKTIDAHTESVDGKNINVEESKKTKKEKTNKSKKLDKQNSKEKTNKTKKGS